MSTVIFAILFAGVTKPRLGTSPILTVLFFIAWVDKLARLMFANRTYISHMIKENYNYFFSDYINGERVKFAKELMRSHLGKKQDELAEKRSIY